MAGRPAGRLIGSKCRQPSQPDLAPPSRMLSPIEKGCPDQDLMAPFGQPCEPAFLHLHIHIFMAIKTQVLYFISRW